MFRTQNHVPEIYVNESRDFQLFCRAKDLIFGGVKYEIDSLRHTSNTKEINDRLLPLLKSKLGYFSEDKLTYDQLRVLLSTFPYIIRYKGSNKAIEYTVNTWLRIYNREGRFLRASLGDYTIRIEINSEPLDTSLLSELFKYIIPTGYEVLFVFGQAPNYNDIYGFKDSIQWITVDANKNAQLLGTDDNAEVKKHSENIEDSEVQAFAERLTHQIGLTILTDGTKETTESTGGENE